MLVSGQVAHDAFKLTLLLQSILRTSSRTCRSSSHLPSSPFASHSLRPRMSSTKIAIHNHETYLSGGLNREDLQPNPLDQFSAWFKLASDSDAVVEPEAVALSTVDAKSAVPSTRFVLLKQVDERGFRVFTNYESRKGAELFGPNHDEKGGFASMAFYWRPLHLSVRIVGRAEKVEKEVTEEYFKSRPVGSRIGAWASKQSSVLSGGREELEDCVKQIEAKFGVKDGSAQASAVDVGPAGKTTEAQGDVDIPVPPFWGGVRIVPFEMEFWAGRESRLHDRFRYTRPEGSDGEWEIVRLAP